MIHQKRRAALLEQLEPGCVVIISTNSEKLRCGDVHYPFRADSDFFYLTGFNEPEAVMVLTHDTYHLFLRDKDPAREIWDGERLGVERACQILGANKAYAIDKIEAQLKPIIDSATAIYFEVKSTALDEQILTLLREQPRKSVSHLVHEMRLVKDDSEIAIMQAAANISAKAHMLAMQSVKPGQYEYELQSIFDGFFAKHNTVHAYTPIVAGGANACVLHYINNNQVLNEGDLVLIDAGCELENYASDITRTFPINGKFTSAQKQIYQLVLDAQTAAIECIKPGVRINQMHEISSQVIKQGLMELGLIQSGEELSEFFMHGTGHWLGLDVHDVGSYKTADEFREFTPGMITTVEPGIYIRENAKIDPVYHNIGVRIEDNVLVTDNGHQVLTRGVVKEINDIENLMK